jgi:hypothetical protein
VDYPTTYKQPLKWFPDDDACLDYLVGLGWPDSVCARPSEKSEFWRTGRVCGMCCGGDRKTLVTWRDDLSPDARDAVDVVRGDLVRDLVEKRDLGTRALRSVDQHGRSTSVRIAR